MTKRQSLRKKLSTFSKHKHSKSKLQQLRALLQQKTAEFFSRLRPWLPKYLKSKVAHSEQPFSISWPVQEMLGSLPHNRWTFRSTWEGKSVIIKIYASKRVANRAVRNFYTLQGRGILMPELYQVTTDNTGYYTCLIFEELPHIDSTTQAQEAPAETCQKLIPIIASQHALGVVQKDMQINNFIMLGDVVYTIDTDTIVCRNRALKEKESLKSLAQLIVQFFPDVKAQVPEFCKSYCEQRMWKNDPHILQQLQQEISDFSEFRKKKFLKQIFRDSKLVRKNKTFSDRIFWRTEVDTPAFRDFLEHPESVFNPKNAQFLKRGNSRTVVKAEIDGKPYVIKRYNLKNKRYALSRLPRPSNAVHAWRMAHLFEFLHIPSPKPIALIEKRWGPLYREAYLVTEFLEGEILLNMNIPKEEQAKVQMQVLGQIAKMHAEHITHGDLKLANILIADGKPIILDVDSAQTHYWLFLKMRRVGKDNARFLSEVL